MNFGCFVRYPQSATIASSDCRGVLARSPPRALNKSSRRGLVASIPCEAAEAERLAASSAASLSAMLVAPLHSRLVLQRAVVSDRKQIEIFLDVYTR